MPVPVVAGAGFSVLPRRPCAGEPARGAPALLDEPQDAPVNTSFLVRRPGTSDNPHVALVRDRLPEAARAW